MHRGRFVVLALLGALLLVGGTLLAQDTPAPEPATVSDDAVNDVARHMYCPVCENEPLDTCRALNCILWRQEIREQLAAGRTKDEIIDSFVERYGDRVVGIPRDPLLRWLSLLGPVVITALALGVGVRTFLRWRDHQPASVTADVPSGTPSGADDAYLKRLEDDLRS